MTADEIRALAIERIARWSIERLGHSWDDASDLAQRSSMRVGAAYVDALGDLLPTGVEDREALEVRTGFGDETNHVPHMCRYVTEWRPVG